MSCDCDCDECCRSCCYSTPFSTLVALIFTALGLSGFAITGFFGASTVDSVSLQNGTEVNVMAPVIAIAVLATIVPLVLVTITSYCITGYIRDILFSGTIKCCIKSYFLNVTVMVVTFILILVWVLLSIGLGGVMSYYIQWVLTCPEAGQSPDVCITYVDSGFSRLLICGSMLEEVCPTATQAGVTLSIALLFAVLVIIGLIIILVLHSTQFVNGRDYYDYRHSQKQDGFLSKNSR